MEDDMNRMCSQCSARADRIEELGEELAQLRRLIAECEGVDDEIGDTR